MLPVTGNLLGTVVDTAGAPQIGASVKLFNKYDRVVAKTLSTSDGRLPLQGWRQTSIRCRFHL